MKTIYKVSLTPIFFALATMAIGFILYGFGIIVNLIGIESETFIPMIMLNGLMLIFCLMIIIGIIILIYYVIEAIYNAL